MLKVNSETRNGLRKHKAQRDKQMIETCNQKVLVVDDNMTTRMEAKKIFEKKEFEVLLAEDGQTCLEALEEEKPDVVLLDMVMPEMDGIAVCQRIKSDERFKDIPVLLLTDVTDVESKVKALNAGADDYVTKPFERKKLVARVSLLLRTKGLTEQLKQEIDRRKQVEEELTAYHKHLELMVKEPWGLGRLCSLPKQADTQSVSAQS